MTENILLGIGIFIALGVGVVVVMIVLSALMVSFDILFEGYGGIFVICMIALILIILYAVGNNLSSAWGWV